MNAAGQTLCLNMIVKNEMANLPRCLGAVADHIACWVIGDTGSSDGTQDFIRSFFAERGIPGELHEFPFVNFELARNEALDRAHASKLAYDYLLFDDADMELVVEDPDFHARLEAPGYQLIQRADSGLVYWNVRLARRDAGVRYRGVTHEYLDVPGGTQQLKGVWYKDHASGANRVDKFERDARLLTEALKTDPDNHRYWFYLAQSYRDAGRTKEAAEAYAKRAGMGGWDQEIFWSLYQAAQLKEELGHDREEVIALYLRASDAAPNRAEALHGASRLCRNAGRNQEGYEIAKRGLALTAPADGLFIETWIYDYGLLDEFAVSAYWAGHYRESLDACLRLLARSTLPDGYRDRTTANARFALDKLPQQPVPGALDVMVWPAGSASPGIPLAMPAIATPRGVSGMVSVITPTYNRDGFLKNALTYFRSQDYENIEWLILDDSPQASGSLSDLTDKNISYQHVDRKRSIGEKRNILIEKAKGEIIVQFDDDDYYAPNYVITMVSALADRDADLVNLRGWFLYDVRSHFFGYWDLMQKEGPHYRCDQAGVALTMLNSQNNSAFDNNHLGFLGFSAFKKKVWEAVKFPAIDWNEDGQFSLQAKSKFKLDGIHDTKGLVLHFLHPDSTSRCFPQHHLPRFLFQRLFPALEYPGPVSAVYNHSTASFPVGGHVAGPIEAADRVSYGVV